MLYSNPRGLYLFQAELSAVCYLRPRNLAVVDTGLGKGLEVGTGVLRPDGSWTPVEALQIGDFVVGGDGNPVLVEGVFDRGVQPGFTVTTDDGVSINVDADHLWTVATDLDISRGIPWRTLDTTTLSQSLQAPGRKRWRIPVTIHRGGGGDPLPVDPYILGVLLGDGHMGNGQIGFVSVDDGIVQEVKERLPEGVEMRVDIFESGAATRYRFVGSVHRQNPMLAALRDLGVAECRSWEKFVPSPYLRSGEQDRRALLAGLMDTDGWVGGAQQFTSVSERLANDVAYLVRSLGGVARVSSKTSWLNGQQHRDAFNVSIRMDRCPFFLGRKVDRWASVQRNPPSRKIASIAPIVGGIHSVCIKVAAVDGLFVTEGFVVTHNTHLALATACLLIEDDQIDLLVVVAEGNKVDEWVDDIATFTELNALRYRADAKTRRKKAATLGEYQAMVCTYQTAREDLVDNSKTMNPGFLLEALRGRRVLFVYDEVTLLSGRTSGLHKVHRKAVEELGARVLGLTATPVTRSPENLYNLGRIFCPDLVGTVAEFESAHVVRKDTFGNPSQFRNLDLLAEKMAPVLVRKRKTDIDVVAQFPREVEDFVKIRLSPDHERLYAVLDGLVQMLPEDEQRYAFNILRTFANHPRSLQASQSTLAEKFFEIVSPNELNDLVCTKSEAVVRQVRTIVSQGSQVVVFCDSVTVLNELADDMVKARLDPAIYTGAMTHDAREASKAAFKSGDNRVLLASSAAERGVNLPEASYIINYDVPLLHSSYIQRLSRASRIGSNAGEILVVKTYIAASTVEEGAVKAWNRRNRQSDTLIDFDVDDEDENFVSASDRMNLIREAQRSTP